MHLVNRLTQHDVGVFEHRERRKTHRLKAVENDKTDALHPKFSGQNGMS